MADIYSQKDFEWYERQRLVAPARYAHPSEEDIARNLVPMKVQKWTMEGNRLIGETASGTFGQPIPVDYICKGIDREGNPVLEKVKIS